MTEPLFPQGDFLIPSGIAHLCAGGESASLRAHVDALRRWTEDKSGGIEGRAREDDHVEAARVAAARLMNTAVADTAFVPSVADGVAALVATIDWREGDNVVVDASEFPSLVVPFRLLRRPRLEVRIVPGGPLRAGEQAAGAERYTPYVDAGTRVLAASHVSYWSGERLDLSVLRALADRVEALLIVDFTQSAGTMPIDATVADFAFAACYKWLLAAHGVAIATWNRARQPDWVPAGGGWNSVVAPPEPDHAAPLRLRDDARRLTAGNVAYASVYMLEESLAYLAGFGLGRVAAHVMALSTECIAALDELGVPLITPRDGRRRGASVVFRTTDPEGLAQQLAHAGVYVWGSEGRVRVSVHGYNGSHDIRRLAKALTPVITGSRTESS